jgi:hypothetical protein
MGYSIAIRARSITLRAKMLAFMTTNYQSWPALMGHPDGPCYASSPTGDLSYDRSKLALGLDYGVCSGWEREWAFTIIRWMALKVGSNRKTFSNGIKVPTPTPFMVYDGYETWPLIVGTKATAKKLSKDFQWCAVDAQGIHNGPNAEGDLVQHGIFDMEDPNAVTQRVLKKIGQMPDEGDRHAWRAVQPCPSQRARRPQERGPKPRHHPQRTDPSRQALGDPSVIIDRHPDRPGRVEKNLKFIGYWHSIRFNPTTHDVEDTGYEFEKYEKLSEDGVLSLPFPSEYRDPDPDPSNADQGSNFAWDPIEKAKVVAYLKTTSKWELWRGYSWCRFGCGEKRMGSCDLTDGQYVWPEGFAHYVERHGVKPPAEFIAHVLARGP